MAKKWTLTWLGTYLADEIFEEVIKPSMIEFGLKTETRAKSKLQISLQDEDGGWVRGGGRGKRQGTLQRSIHLAVPGYNWGGDAGGTGELGGTEVVPIRSGDSMIISIGSGIEYAIYVHELHYNPEVNGFIVKSVEEQRSSLPSILDKYALGK